MAAPKGNKYAVGSNAGRPTLYRPEYVEQARKLCRLGATDVEMAQFFNVDITTFYLWRATHEEFSQAIIDGKVLADMRMKRSLYQRGIGYNVPVVKVEKRLIGKGKDAKLTVVKEITSVDHVPGDVNAQRLWLTNRLPKEWRDKMDINHAIPPGMTEAEARDDLIAYLVECGVRIALPAPGETIEGTLDEQES